MKIPSSLLSRTGIDDKIIVYGTIRQDGALCDENGDLRLPEFEAVMRQQIRQYAQVLTVTAYVCCVGGGETKGPSNHSCQVPIGAHIYDCSKVQ